MARSPCCDEKEVKKGPWTPEEDKKLKDYIEEHGMRSWRALPALAGLNRCGKSCRLRWTNYLRPDIKRGNFTEEEEEAIIRLHSELGNKWSVIATHLPGRTDNEIKNHWNTHLRKKLLQRGIDPVTHKPRPDLTLMASLPDLLALASNLQTTNVDVAALRNATHLARLQLVQSILNLLVTSPPSPQIDPNVLQLLHSGHMVGLIDQAGQLQGVDVPPPAPVIPDYGLGMADAVTNFQDVICTDYMPELVNTGLVNQVDTTPGYMDTSPSTSSASNIYEYDPYDAWSNGLEELVKSDYYGHENCF